MISGETRTSIVYTECLRRTLNSGTVKSLLTIDDSRCAGTGVSLRIHCRHRRRVSRISCANGEFVELRYTAIRPTNVTVRKVDFNIGLIYKAEYCITDGATIYRYNILYNNNINIDCKDH